MSSTTELGEVLRALSQLRTGVDGLYARYGDIPVVRRIENDFQRLEIDVSELSTTAPGAPRQRSGTRSTAPPETTGGRRGQQTEHEVVEVPDTPYEPSWWRGADDEGLGGQAPRED